MSKAANTVLAIDPGRSKCGLAITMRTFDQVCPVKVIHQEIVNTSDLCQSILDLAGRFSLDIIVIGNGTTSSQAAQTIEKLQIAPIEIVDERYTTLLARKKYFEHNPPRGIRRLIPISLQTPSRPYDDFVAILLAERFLTS